MSMNSHLSGTPKDASGNPDTLGEDLKQTQDVDDINFDVAFFNSASPSKGDLVT
jgi:hypothetical protein